MSWRMHWIICAREAGFLRAASAMVCAGCAGPVEWEPDAGKACLRLRQLVPSTEVYVLVAGDLPMGAPELMAERMRDMGASATVYCGEGVEPWDGGLPGHGELMSVDPDSMIPLLMAMCREPGVEAHDITDDRQPGEVPSPSDICEPDDVPAQARTWSLGELEFMPDGVLPGNELFLEEQVQVPLVPLPQRDAAVAGADEPVPTVCFASARGGVGKSSLAVMCALACARRGLNVALLDLDYQFGTCASYLGSMQSDGLYDPGTPAERVHVDAYGIARCRTKPLGNLDVYEFARTPEQAEVLAGLTSELVKQARAGAQIAFIDLPCGLDESVAQAVELSDRCLFVIDQRARSLESTGLMESFMVRLGIPRTRLSTVVNRCDPKHRDEGFLSRAQFEIQTPGLVTVADGGQEVSQFLDMGKATELMGLRNRFALSATDLANDLMAQLGCADVTGAPVALPAGGPAQGIASQQAPRSLGRLLHRGGPDGRQVGACR